MTTKKKKKKIIDEFHYHEMIDRLSIVLKIVDDVILSHALIEDDPELKSEMNIVSDILAKQYQRVSNIRFNI